MSATFCKNIRDLASDNYHHCIEGYCKHLSNYADSDFEKEYELDIANFYLDEAKYWAEFDITSKF